LTVLVKAAEYFFGGDDVGLFVVRFILAEEPVQVFSLQAGHRSFGRFDGPSVVISFDRLTRGEFVFEAFVGVCEVQRPRRRRVAGEQRAEDQGHGERAQQPSCVSQNR
jgi:hypothetical protein